MFGIDRKNWDANYRDLLDESNSRRATAPGRRRELWVDLFALGPKLRDKWAEIDRRRIEAQLRAQMQAAGVGAGGAPIDAETAMLLGSSPALEEFRRARAGQEQLKLEKMKGELVYVADAREVMTQFGQHFRRGLDKLRAWPRAHEVMSAAIDHAQRELARWEPATEQASEHEAGQQAERPPDKSGSQRVEAAAEDAPAAVRRRTKRPSKEP